MSSEASRKLERALLCVVAGSVLLATGGTLLTACSGGGAASAPDARASRDAAGHDASVDATRDAPSRTDARSDAGATDANDAGIVDVTTSSEAAFAACTADTVPNCELQEQCNPSSVASAYGDAANCVPRFRLSCLANHGLKGSSATAAGAYACGQARMTESCTAYLNDESPDACATAPGTLDAGSPCASNGQCASRYCSTPLQSACGTCQPLPVPGAPCGDLATCGTDLVCYSFRDEPSVCARYVLEPGAACGPGQPCGAGLSCVVPKEAGAGICEPAGTVAGAPCDSTQTTAGGCSFGLTCNSISSSPEYNTCQPELVATPGESCKSLGVLVACVGGSTCQATDGGGRTCIPRAADDASCNSFTGPQCIPPARCLGTLVDGGVKGTCVAPSVKACP